MCGIAGIMTRFGTPPDSGALAAMTQTLSHRGPDGDGHYTAGGVGLVHTRLAIIDLDTGDQPFSEPGGAVLVANGEFYNYRELRAELTDVEFKTTSDCEPPLHLYRRHGAGFTDYLRGMYAVAIHDAPAGRLVLARDPFGIKPLYYAETDAGFVFASEIQALVAAGLVAPVVDERARDELLQLQFTTGDGTIVAGVKRVLPGETLVVEKGRIAERRRQAALPAGAPADIGVDEAMAKLDAALMESVDLHQRADVPYGMFLSGGIDSSALLALMARLNEAPVMCFSAGFPETKATDEREHARAVAEALGAKAVDVPVTKADFWAELPAIAAAMDDPAADYAIVPTYILGRAAGRELKVVLTGEGGDELFAGYGRYRKVRRPRWLGGRRMRSRGTFFGMGVLRDHSSAWRDGIAAAGQEAAMAGRNALQIAQATDCADWLPNDLLTKADRCLMAHGVEGRVPFLDTAVADLAFRLPDNLKIQGRMGKVLLRRWLDQALPMAQAFSKKRGFTVPVGEWIASQGAKLGPLLAAQPGIQETCRPDRVAALFETLQKAPSARRPAFAAWTILFYALWHRRHILGAAPAGDVFETLSQRP